MEIIDSESGAVAVHCKAGLGRTGTLIGLYMMKKYMFTAREVIAWLRVLRPGSVLGQQQQYLCQMEQQMHAEGRRPPRTTNVELVEQPQYVQPRVQSEQMAYSQKQRTYSYQTIQ